MVDPREYVSSRVLRSASIPKYHHAADKIDTQPGHIAITLHGLNIPALGL